MPLSTEKRLDSDKARRIWDEFARTHDLTGKEQLAVGIDPETEEVFFGTTAKQIVARLREEGQFRPLFFRWVNDPCYFHKGGRR